jgi:3-deoxy-D-manno-octulosonic-acid transferase
VEDKPVLLVGSAWEEDMELILSFINAHPEFRCIIAPHDIDVHVIDRWQKRIDGQSIKYSEIEKHQGAKVLFIDNIGMLSSLYQYARIAYVGGAFGKGLHNILEPLAYGIPVIFGNLQKVSKFPEAEISKNQGCGFTVFSGKEFEEIMDVLQNPEVYREACVSAEKMVAENLGSATKIIQSVMAQIKKS